MDKNTLNIVVADDHKLFRKGICALLYDFEFINKVEEAANGQELISLINAKEELPDLILLDIQMPVMDGVETTKHLKARFPDIRIIIISMEENVQMVAHLVDLGVDGYLLKNADPDELELAIRMTMKNEYYFSSSLAGAFMNNSKKTAPELADDKTGLFSERELQVLDFICKEHTAAEIAEKMALSTRTIEGYKRNLLSKANTRNVAGLVIYAIKNNLVKV